MKTYRAALFLVLLAIIVQGCAIIDYRPDPETATYLAAKTAIYGFWRSGGPIDTLRASKCHLEALAALLEANSEAMLDATVAQYLTKYAAGLRLDADRRLVGEVVLALLASFRLQNPALLSERRREVALWVVGGMIDGIILAEEAARDG